MSCSPTHSRKESIHPMAIIYHKINQYMYLNYQIHRKPQKQKCILQNFFWVGKLQIVLYILLSLFRFLFDRVQLNLLLYNHQKLPISTTSTSCESLSQDSRPVLVDLWDKPSVYKPRGQTFPPLSAHTEVSYHHLPLSGSAMSLGLYDRPRSIRNWSECFVMVNKNFPLGWHFMLTVCHMKNKLPPLVTSV